jgi:hypothetical protein
MINQYIEKYSTKSQITKLVADSYPVRRGTATKIALDQKLELRRETPSE